MNRSECNSPRMRADGRGHYESWFQRANHPTRKLAFWIRYTIFEPKGRPADAVAELWAIYFDMERERIIPCKSVVPLRDARFGEDLDIRIGDATLGADSLRGNISTAGHSIAWDLRYSSPEAPLLLLQAALYEAPLPKAKLLVGSPLARFDGTLEVDGEQHSIESWLGSQNHNWGSKHTDEYAWGQVAGFDGAESSFLELATARIRLGPLKSPWLTPIVLRHEGRELRWDRITTALRATASYGPFEWRFESEANGLRIEGELRATKDDFVGLLYDNPPGGRKVCLNSKLASARIRVTGLGRPLELESKCRAAFEMLVDERHPNVPTLEV